MKRKVEPTDTLDLHVDDNRFASDMATVRQRLRRRGSSEVTGSFTAIYEDHDTMDRLWQAIVTLNQVRLWHKIANARIMEPNA